MKRSLYYIFMMGLPRLPSWLVTSVYDMIWSKNIQNHSFFFFFCTLYFFFFVRRWGYVLQGFGTYINQVTHTLDTLG